MSSLLSTPVFVSGPDDKIATVDLYKADGKLVNQIRDISDQFKAVEVESLKGGNNLQDAVKTTLVRDTNAGNLGIQLDTDSLVKGLLAVNPGMVSALRSLPAGMQAELTKVKGYSDIAGTLGGVTSQISKANLSTVNGLATMINGISGANLPFDFKDKKGLIQLSVSLIIQSTKVGIKGALKPFIDNITDKRIIRGIVAGVASQAITNNMTDLLKDTATSTIGRVIVKTAGGVSLQILQGYADEHRPKIARKYTKYNNTALALTAINIAWQEYKRGPANAVSTAVEGGLIQKASPAFKQDMRLAAAWKGGNITIPADVSTINTAINTSAEAYMCLIGPELSTNPKADMKQKLSFVNFA
jgi:hypothetical protein